jgi:hypothetical protein
LVTRIDEDPSLYDLSHDLREENNLAAQKPQIVKELSDILMTWDAGLLPPPDRTKREPGKKRRPRNRPRISSSPAENGASTSK